MNPADTHRPATHRRQGLIALTALTALAALVALLAGTVQAAPAAAAAADLAGTPIRMIVPFTAGGSSDIIARSIAGHLGAGLGTTVVVENKTGANGNIGGELVARSPADGHTLLITDVRSLAISPAVYTRLGFDPSKDMQPVAMLAYSPHLLVVHPDVPANTLPELVALLPEQLLAQGAEVSTMAPADFSRWFEAERKHWASVVATAGVKLE